MYVIAIGNGGIWSDNRAYYRMTRKVTMSLVVTSVGMLSPKLLCKEIPLVNPYTHFSCCFSR